MGCGSSTATAQAVNANGQHQNGKPVANISVGNFQDIQSNGQQAVDGLNEAEKLAQQPRIQDAVKSVEEATIESQSEVLNPTQPPINGDTEPKDVPKYTEASLKEFLQLQKKIEAMQQTNVVGQYRAQHKMLVSLYENLQAAQKKVDTLKQQTAKEYKEVTYMQHPNVRAMFSNAHQLQFQIDKEQRDYMEALNRQEVSEKELSGLQTEYNALYGEVGVLRKEYVKLEDLQKEEEEKLEEIFGSKYGSDLEEKLEDQTELLHQRKDLVKTTQTKWNNAKNLMVHASNQLGYAARRWAQINTVNKDMVQARYSMVADSRNYLIAASQNITNTHRYLGNVEEPYCTPQDLEILNYATTTIFQDVMACDTYNRALQTYHSLHVRAYNLQQWIIMVLEKTINKDLEEIVPEYQAKMVELRRERLRLINIKIRELRGEEVPDDDVTVDQNANMVRSEDDTTTIPPSSSPEVTETPSDVHIAQPDAVSLKDETTENESDIAPPAPSNDGDPQSLEDEVTRSLSTDQAKEPDVQTTASNVDNNASNETETKEPEQRKAVEKPKPLTELAPLPSMDTLFGNIEELKTKYEQQVAEFTRAQDVNKARVDQSLEEKLRARRSKRIKIEINDVEISDLAKGLSSLVSTK